MKQKIARPSAVAGLFYPGNSKTLERDVNSLLANVHLPAVSESIVALISPHAGYIYSGQTAAHGFHLLQGKKFDTVVIVSPSHREYFKGISVYNGSAYSTPLGELQIDKQLRTELLAGETIIEASSRGHQREHAIEVQLPFIQHVLGNVKILPIVMGDQRREYCFHLGNKLSSILHGKKALLIASTDLSHYHTYHEAETLDSIIINSVQRFDEEDLMATLETERSEACGGGPTVAVLVAAKKLGANEIKILHYCNSGDVTGDHANVVGYLSAVALRRNF